MTTYKGLKYDDNKPMLSLLDPYFLEDMAKVMTFGAVKYQAENWRAGINMTRIISSLQRHLLAIEKGQNIDVETNYQHAAHIGCNAMFLHYYINNKKEFDDRFYKPAQVIHAPTPAELANHNPGIDSNFEAKNLQSFSLKNKG